MEPEIRHAGDIRKAHDSLQKLRGRSVYIETYGCRYNFGDTAKLVEILRHQGCTIVGTADNAETVIVNTCTVVGPTERRMLRRLAGFRDHDLIVTGCMPKVQRAAICGICSPTIILPEAIQEIYQSLGTVSGGGVGIVQLGQGCTGHCTYCITRLARGPLMSFSKKEILDQVRAYIRAGTVEIQLTAQDVSSWGMDTGDSLPDLLEAIDRIPGQHRIRVGMMNPATVKEQTADLVDVFSGHHLFKFVHLPVQSGCDRILKRMGRGYTVTEFEGIVRAFRKRYPEITIATDMIVGFCGETPADFQASLDLIRKVKPAKVNVTRFSRRPFTPVARENDFPDHIKKDRSRTMNAVADEIYSAVNSVRIGSTVPFVVTESLRKGSVMARSPDYTGIVIREDLPVGFCGEAILKMDRKYFFIGDCIPSPGR